MNPDSYRDEKYYCIWASRTFTKYWVRGIIMIKGLQFRKSLNHNNPPNPSMPFNSQLRIQNKFNRIIS